MMAIISRYTLVSFCVISQFLQDSSSTAIVKEKNLVKSLPVLTRLLRDVTVDKREDCWCNPVHDCEGSGWQCAKVCTRNDISVCCGCNCFPAAARVSLETGETITMAELQRGDRVKTVLENGETTFSEVKAFLKKQPHVTGTYKSITTSTNQTITLSPNHLIYARKAETKKYDPIYADIVEVGDSVLIENQNKMVPVKVEHITVQTNEGAFVPLTTEGNILVDGVLASCYASFNHDIQQVVMKPLLWFPGLMDLLLGEEKSIHSYVTILEQAGEMMSLQVKA